MKYKSVIFDLDGTLMDTLEDLYISTNYVLRHCGLPERSLAEVCVFVGNGVRKLIERAVPAGVSSAKVDELCLLFREHYAHHCRDHSAPYKGILPLLASLADSGVKMAIVSNKPNQEVNRLNEEFFAKYISVAIGENEAAGIHRKPSPEMLQEAMRQLGVPSAEVLYVGDSDVDIQTASNACVDCASVTWGFRDEAFLQEHNAMHIVHSPEELLRFVLGKIE